MDLGHGFLPRIDARNYKAVERCLPRDGPGLFSVGLDLPWAILEGPWALQHGAPTIELCRDRGVSFLVDTQAWRYHDPRTFLVEKFARTPYAPAGPLGASDRSALSRFVEADLDAHPAGDRPGRAARRSTLRRLPRGAHLFDGSCAPAGRRPAALDRRRLSPTQPREPAL